MPKSRAQARIAKYFQHLPIWYQPGLTLVFDSPSIGIFLSQILYWQDKSHLGGGWIYKTTEELRKETGLSRYNQGTAIRKCCRLGFLELRHGRGNIRMLRLNLSRLEELIPSLMESHNLEYLIPPNRIAAKQPTNTESTSKTTSENTKVFDNNSFQASKKRLIEKRSHPP